MQCELALVFGKEDAEFVFWWGNAKQPGEDTQEEVAHQTKDQKLVQINRKQIYRGMVIRYSHFRLTVPHRQNRLSFHNFSNTDFTL